MQWKKIYLFAIFLLCLSSTANAQVVDELRSKIEERNSQIKQLETEISQYNIVVQNAGLEAKTLLGTLKTLDLTKNKISKDINLTEKKISNTSSTISQINSEISATVDHINLNRKAIIAAFKNTDIQENNNIVAVMLGKKNINEIWSDIDNTQKIQDVVREKSKELIALKAEMSKKQDELSKQKTNLVGLRQDLNGKKLAVEYTVAEKAAILAQTKNKEAAFKELVKTKEEQKAQFEKEIYDFESQLNILIDKGSYPSPRKNILSWPVDDVFITQKFGKTVGAEKLYKSGSHNGVDFRASVGTKVKNVLTGTVVGTGNTDLTRGCYSFGKWVMVKHDNGLSTIYGHLSVISANMGQRLQTGDLIGFSGNSGYSTGPHLHISLYATQGVRIEKYTNSRGCKDAVLPLADVKAYLDPLAYFPEQ